MADNYNNVFSSTSNTKRVNSRAFFRCGDGDTNSTSKSEEKSVVLLSSSELKNNGDSSSMLQKPKNYHEPENSNPEEYCKLKEPDDFIVELLLKDTRRDHENFTSRLHFLPNDSSLSRTSEFMAEAPTPLYYIDVPKLSNITDDLEYLIDDLKSIAIDGDWDCGSKETWGSTGTTQDDEDSYVLLSPRTFCRKVETEVTNCCPQNQNQVDAPQLFEVDMNDDNTKESSQENLPSTQSANLADDISIASSIYHAANSESLLSDLGSTHIISPSRSQDSVVSGLDSIGVSLPRELEKCQGMKMTVEYNAEFDGEFSSNDAGPLDMDVLWVNNNVFHDDNGFRSIIISDTTDSPAEEDNDLALEFPQTSSQNLTLDQTPSLEHSFSRFLRQQVSSQDRYIEPTSSASIAAMSEIELADDPSFLTSSSVHDNTDDESSDSDEGSIYDVDFMGRADIFWPMMTKSERKMVGAPSELNLDTHAESETFDVEEDVLGDQEGHPQENVPPTDDTSPLPLADLAIANATEAHQSLDTDGRGNENPDTSFANHANSAPRKDFSEIKRDYMTLGFNFGGSGSGDDSDVGILDLGVSSAWPTLY